MFIICVYQKYVKYRGVNLSRGLGALHARPVWPNLEATGFLGSGHPEGSQHLTFNDLAAHNYYILNTA